MPVSSTTPTPSADQQPVGSSEASSATPAPPPTGSTAPAAAGAQRQQGKHGRWKNQPPPPPTNCVVLKNLDYGITQLNLEEVVRRVTGGRKEFVNIALIEDKATGSFRGMAFVNFHTTADATAALAELSKMVINGRKVIAEYRRLRPGEKERQEKRAKRFDHFNNSNRQTFEKDVQDTDEKGVRVDKRAAFFAKRDTVRKEDEQKRIEEKAERDKEREAEFRKSLLEYKAAEVPDGSPVEDIIFESSLSSYERRMVHTICGELDLGHISRVNEDGDRVLHVSKDPERKAEWDKETAKIKAALKKEEAQKRRNKENGSNQEWKKGDTTTGGPLTKEELQGIKWFKPRAALGASSDANNSSEATGIRAPSYKLYVPPRQPCGPDGTIGFKSRNPGGKEEADDSVSEETRADPAVQGVDEEDCSAGSPADDGENVEDKQNDKQGQDCEENESSHTVLNPSVPAFSPSLPQTF